MTDKKKTSRSTVSRRTGWSGFWFYWGWIILGVLFLILQRILAMVPAWTEHYFSNGIFRWISWPLLRISSLVPFSLTELLVVVLLPLFVIFMLGRAIYRLRKNPKQRLWRSINGLVYLGWTASGLLLLFMLLHGFNYARLPVAESFDLPVRERTTAELTDAAAWIAQEAAEIREGLAEDDNGVFALGQPLRQTMLDANEAFFLAAQDWPAMAGYPVRAKGVRLSHAWSYTGITGVYNPWLVEANVNIDQPDYGIPDTVAHEIAHTMGFAREDEAGFIAFLAGMYAQRPDYRYSVLATAWVRLSNRLYVLDREGYEQAAAPVSDAMRRDYAAARQYWQQFEGPVREVSTQANNLYLQANMQTDGVQSYGRMIDLVLAWYELTVKGQQESYADR